MPGCWFVTELAEVTERTDCVGWFVIGATENPCVGWFVMGMAESCVVGWLEEEMGVGVGAVYVGTFTLIGMGAAVGPVTPGLVIVLFEIFGFGVGVTSPVGPCGPTNGVAVRVGVTAGIDVTLAAGAGVLAGTPDLPVVCVAL